MFINSISPTAKRQGGLRQFHIAMVLSAYCHGCMVDTAVVTVSVLYCIVVSSYCQAPSRKVMIMDQKTTRCTTCSHLVLILPVVLFTCRVYGVDITRCVIYL